VKNVRIVEGPLVTQVTASCVDLTVLNHPGIGDCHKISFHGGLKPVAVLRGLDDGGLGLSR